MDPIAMQEHLNALAKKIVTATAANHHLRAQKAPGSPQLTAGDGELRAGTAQTTTPAAVQMGTNSDLAQLLLNGCAELEASIASQPSLRPLAGTNWSILSSGLSDALLKSLGDYAADNRKAAEEREALRAEVEELRRLHEITRATSMVEPQSPSRPGLDREAAAALIETLRAREEEVETLKDGVALLSSQLQQRDRRLKELAAQAEDAEQLRRENEALRVAARDRDDEFDRMQAEVEMLKARLERVAVAAAAVTGAGAGSGNRGGSPGSMTVAPRHR